MDTALGRVGTIMPFNALVLAPSYHSTRFCSIKASLTSGGLRCECSSMTRPHEAAGTLLSMAHMDISGGTVSDHIVFPAEIDSM